MKKKKIVLTKKQIEKIKTKENVIEQVLTAEQQKYKENVEAYKKEHKEILAYIADKLDMKEINTLVCVAMGEAKDGTKCWNWRLHGPYECLISLIESFKYALISGKLSNEAVREKANVSTEELLD